MLAEEIIDKLQIVPTDKLHAHEEIIPYNFQKLREAMLSMGRLVDPLIIDSKHYVVIDGNHRKAVLDSIQSPNAACQVIDYEKPEVEIGSWFPISKTMKHSDVPNFKPEPIDFETGMREINKMHGTFLYVKKLNGKKECFLYDSNEQTLRGVIGQQRQFISSVEGRDLQYVPDDMFEEYLNAGYAVFFRRLYGKEEVISEALAGRCMPPKSTRHIVPNRIIRLNLSLGWLAEPQAAAKQMMDNMLKKRLNEGSIRRYVEPVIVLY